MKLSLKKKQSAGLTIIETIVVLTLFSMLIAPVVAIFTTVLKSQRISFASQGLQESLRNFMETVSKDIKWGYIVSNGGTDFNYLDLCVYDEFSGDYKNVTYALDSVNKKIVKSMDGVDVDLTPANVAVDTLFFNVLDKGNNGSFQSAAVRISTQFSLVSAKSELKNINLSLQTIVASRFNDPINPCP